MPEQPVYADIRDAVLTAAAAADPDELDGRNRAETAVVVIAAMMGTFSNSHHAAYAIGEAGEDYLVRVDDDTERREKASRLFYEELARYAASGLETCARYEAAQQARLEAQRAANQTNPKVDPKTLRLDTGDLLGRVIHDPAVHPDQPWLWDIVDRRTSSDESGIATHGMVQSRERYPSQDEAITALERAVADMTREGSR